MQAVTESVRQKEWVGRAEMGFDHYRLDHAEIGSRHYPLRSIPIEVLSFGLDGPAVNRLHGVRLRGGRNPKTSRKTDRQ